jgi:hypothetical protein
MAKPFAFAGRAVTPLMAAGGIAETAGNYQGWRANPGPGSSFRNEVFDPAMAQVGDIAGYMGGPVSPVAKAVQLASFATNPAYQSRRFAQESYDPDMHDTLGVANNALRGVYNPFAAVGGLTHSIGDWWKNRGVAQQSQQAADASQAAGVAARAANPYRSKAAQETAATPAITAQPGKEPSGTAKITKYEDRAPVGKTSVSVQQVPGTSNATGPGTGLVEAARFKPVKRAADSTGVVGPEPIAPGLQQPKTTPPIALAGKQTAPEPNAPITKSVETGLGAA